MCPSKDINTFPKFFKLIKNRKYTTAMLQEFLFFNRYKDSIYDFIDDFYHLTNIDDENYFTRKEKDNIYL